MTSIQTERSEEGRARECLADAWRDSGRPDLADSIAACRDSEWSKSAVAIRAMQAFALSERNAEREKAAKECEWLIHVIGAQSGSSIHSALTAAATAIRSNP